VGRQLDVDDDRVVRTGDARLADVIEIVEPDPDDLSRLERRCELSFDYSSDSEVV
jgi:hypothetical protein